MYLEIAKEIMENISKGLSNYLVAEEKDFAECDNYPVDERREIIEEICYQDFVRNARKLRYNELRKNWVTSFKVTEGVIVDEMGMHEYDYVTISFHNGNEIVTHSNKPLQRELYCVYVDLINVALAFGYKVNCSTINAMFDMRENNLPDVMCDEELYNYEDIAEVIFK